MTRNVRVAHAGTAGLTWHQPGMSDAALIASPASLDALHSHNWPMSDDETTTMWSSTRPVSSQLMLYLSTVVTTSTPPKNQRICGRGIPWTSAVKVAGWPTTTIWSVRPCTKTGRSEMTSTLIREVARSDPLPTCTAYTPLSLTKDFSMDNCTSPLDLSCDKLQHSSLR